jgi:hypothetical protein
MSNIKKLVFSEVKRDIDFSTGETNQETSTKVVKIPTEPPYVKLYIDDLCAIVDIPDSLKTVLLQMLRKLDYDGYITLSTRFRKELCEKLSIKDQTLRNRLTDLVKKQLLIKDGTNEYIANPHYFARGDWKKIIEQREAFTMKITYSDNGRTIITERADLE